MYGQHEPKQDGKRSGERQIIPFPAVRPAPVVLPAKPLCLWCRDPFVRRKVNQRYCCRQHRKAACARRKEALLEQVAGLLIAYGASPVTALAKAGLVIETYYGSGRVQRAMMKLGYRYDEKERMWRR